MDATTIPNAILESARCFGASPAIVGPDGTEIRYHELAQKVFQAAGSFIAAGIVKGDRVAIWAPNTDGWIIAAIGLQAAGGVLVPLNTRLKGPEAAYILRASGARLLLTVSGFLGNDYPAMMMQENVETIERIILLDGETGGQRWSNFITEGSGIHPNVVTERLASLKADDLSDILFTSGTTGRPKGAMTSHGQNVAVYLVYAEKLMWNHHDRLLGINPFFHSFGYKAGWLCSLLQGGTIYPVRSFDPQSVLEMIERYRITLLPGPPTIYQSLLELPLEGRELSSLRLAITGATTVPASLVRQMRANLGFDIVLTAYGLTETCGVVSMSDPGDDIALIANTAGRPIPGVTVRILNHDGFEAAPEAPGDIFVRGPNVMKGYLDDPHGTAEAIDAQGWLKTGDVGFLTHEGCLKITDRSKDIYIAGGFNVYPAEVEQQLMTHPDIADAAVIGVPDQRLGEVGHAFVVLHPGVLLQTSVLSAWLRESLANYKLPRNISFVEALPRNASGKVEKFKLKALVAVHHWLSGGEI